MTDNFELLPPRAPALIEALRAVGYSLETAVADLIDNSISAGARHVWVTFFWKGDRSWVRIIDDGHGMTEAELSDAMRAGTRSPLEERQPADLGRFGLGLKTASFSQARRLVVCSRSKGRVSTRCWDLDYVGETGEWRLLKGVDDGTSALLELPGRGASGTVVLWEKLDRVVGKKRVDDRDAHNHFLHRLEDVQGHLAMVFHRYLEGNSPTLKIYVNGRDEQHRVPPWDPFLRAHPATHPTPPENIGAVRLQGFVLPHRDQFKEDEEEFRKAGGPAGWSAQQGFYVYRRERMLVAGGWLDLGYQNEEHYKLARIAVEIPNSLDHDWNIDVKKSRARPPAELRQRLRELADRTRRQAREVFAHRGKQIRRGAASEPVMRPWRPHVKGGRQAYRIERTHPLVAAVVEQSEGRERREIELLLRLLEETVPVQQIWLDVSEKPEALAPPFDNEPPAEMKKLLRLMYETLKRGGATREQAKDRLRLMEPFDSVPVLIEALDD